MSQVKHFKMLFNYKNPLAFQFVAKNLIGFLSMYIFAAISLNSLKNDGITMLKFYHFQERFD